MDTILYFYKKRNIQKPVIDALQIKDYLLVRVGMDVGENKWFSHSFMPSKETIADVPGEGLEVVRIKAPRFALLKWWQERRKRLKAQRLKARQEEQLKREIDQVRTEIHDFLTELSHYADDRYEWLCVYSDEVRRNLVPSEKTGYDEDTGESRKIRILPALWQEVWQAAEFDAYCEERWVEPLLSYARLHHFVVLGTAPCISFVLSHCARRMKSLRWFLAEEDCTEELTEFVEDFYIDYGLAAVVQPLEGRRVFTRLLLETSEPVCILDFSGEAHVPAGGLARGSIWIDFASVEEKARRILQRSEAVSYISMKEIWKREGKP